MHGVPAPADDHQVHAVLAGRLGAALLQRPGGAAVDLAVVQPQRCRDRDRTDGREGHAAPPAARIAATLSMHAVRVTKSVAISRRSAGVAWSRGSYSPRARSQTITVRRSPRAIARSRRARVPVIE